MELGITLYPEKSEIKDMQAYLTMCRKYGVEYLYLNVLSNFEANSLDDLVELYYPIASFAYELGYKIIYDIAPRIFTMFNMPYHDLSFFNRLHAYGVRIDQPFSGNEESLMTFNEFGINVELQLDNNTHHIDTIFDYRPNKRRLSGGHNFYPQEFTAMNDDHFERCNEVCERHGLPITAYITSQSEGAFCQWKDTTQAPSIERHRYVPLKLQVKEFIARENINRLVVSNCYISEEEAKEISRTNQDMLVLDINIKENLTDIEKKILFEELHFCRGDKSDYSIRSTQSRVKYRGHHFPLHDTQEYLEVGDVIIQSSESGMYAGELQIITKRMLNNHRTSVVGRVVDEELFLLDYVKPWQKFKFENTTI